MKLFHRSSRAEGKPEPVPVVSVQPVPPAAEMPQKISLSAEQKAMLEQPVDPRVDQILQKIYLDKAAAERALKSRQIIEFPGGNPREGRVVQDKNGFWRIIPNPAPATPVELLDAL